MAAGNSADYAITAVEYIYSQSGKKKRIIAVEVRAYDDMTRTLGEPKIWARLKVTHALWREHKTFVTAVFDEGANRWLPGAEVDAVRIGNMLFIRTDGNSTTSDNLGNLPELSLTAL